MSELTPYLAVRDARAAVGWYVEHLGARVTHDPIVMPDGRIGHVELALDGARWMMADEHPEIHVEAPVLGRGVPVTLHLTVEDVDDLVARLVRGGANLDRGPEENGPEENGPQENPVGRVAVLRDPFGHRWFLNQRL